MEEKDTRGWKPKSVADGAGIEGARTGVKRHETRQNDISFNFPAKSPEGAGVPLDNMGNSHANEGADRPEFLEAQNVNVAPSVPLSGFDGIEAPEGGVRLSMEGGTQVNVHPREARGGYQEGGSLAPKSSAVIRTGMGETSRTSPTWKKATIPMAQKSANFENQGSEEGVDEDTGVQSKKGDFTGGHSQIKKGGKANS